jgi:V8-like Glu-specific endopeptidase
LNCPYACIKVVIFSNKIDFSKCGDNNDPNRIAESRAVGLWPWIASLGFWSDDGWNHQCGATLINQTKIITAAHCIEQENDVKERYSYLYK